MQFIYRKAKAHDVPQMHAILKRFGDEKLMLPRSLANLYDFLQTFWVATTKKDEKKITGMIGLQVAWGNLGEIRSLAVEPEYRGYSIGDKLIELLTVEALNLGLKELFVLTYIPRYFSRFAFQEIDKSFLPQKIWSDCFHCVQFPNCDEIAMKKEIF